MTLFRIFLVSIWELLIFVCFSFVSCNKYASDDTFIETPVQLTKLDNNSNVYTVHPEATSFKINCSSIYPVLWNVFSKSAYENLSVTFHSERKKLEINNETHGEVLCHIVTLEFNQIDEGLTGNYTCGNINPDEMIYFQRQEIYIYGGTGEIQSKENLINRGNSIEITTEDYDKRIYDYFQMVIPCALNSPFANRTVEILINRTSSTTRNYFRFTSKRVINGTVFEVIDDCPTVNCHYQDDCLVFGSISKSIGKSHYLRNGMLINCYTTRDKPKDIVKIEVKKSPPIAHTPLRLKMTLNVSYDEPLTTSFKCKSTKPITITTNWKHEISQTSQFLPNFYWNYRTEVKITIPSSFNYFFDTSENEWQLEITCAFNNETSDQVTWSYKLLTTDGFGYDRNKKNILKTIHDDGLECISNAPNSMTAKFVPCSTFNDCQIKSRLLFLSDSRFELSDFTVEGKSFIFRIPKNVSGIVRCFGYETDVNGIVYVGFDFYPAHFLHDGSDSFIDRPHYLLSSKQRDKTLDEKNPLVLSNVSEIFEEDFVSVNCSIPLMLIVSHPQWEFTFRNKTEGIIPDRYILNSRVKAADEVFFMAAEIQLPTSEVLGICCMNLQLATATSAEWSGGVLVKNIESTTELRRKSIQIKVKVKPPQANSNLWTYLAVSFFGLVVLLVIVFSLMIRYIRRQQSIIGNLREEEIALFKDGDSKLINDSESANKNAQNMPYDDNYEVDLMNLNIDYQTCLGSGEFGMVFKATMGTNASKPVAVKCVKHGASANYIRASMSELKVMMFIKFHENVVKIIGAYTQELISHKLLVVMEFCENGDLHDYLRKHSEGFVSLVRDGKLFDNSSNLLNPESKLSGIFSTMDIFRWAGQIANGMKHISSLKIIHGDLAARNVLLDSNFNAKISDFGLSKKLYEYSNYVRKNQTPLPWRWLAVESLTFTEFSISSDVWAYGITLWELFSLGGTPYPGQQFNSEFINMISSGFRLPLPQYATYDMYNLMLMCWREMPADRPTFLEIHSKLEPASYEYYHL